MLNRQIIIELMQSINSLMCKRNKMHYSFKCKFLRMVIHKRNKEHEYLSTYKRTIYNLSIILILTTNKMQLKSQLKRNWTKMCK